MGGHAKTFTDDPNIAPEKVKGSFNIAIGVGVIALIASLAIGLTGESELKKQFFFSYLVAYMTFLMISLGGLFFIIIHHLTRATWGTGFRRIAENLAMNLPFMAVLFVPVILGTHDLFHWSHEDAIAHDHILAWKSGYLNTGFFLIRAVVYFAIWSGLAWSFRSNSVKQDASGDVALTFKMRRIAPAGLLAFALTLTFSGFDWLMSLDPHWFSTIFGLYLFSGSSMSIYAALALWAMWLQRKGSLKHTVTTGNLHDAGKMMFGFMVFWTYIGFSQYFLIWYANVPEETAWWVVRLNHGWEKVALLLLLGHFVVPFWVLMSRHSKRNRTVLALGSGWLLFMQFVDMHYLVMPVMHHGPHFHILDLLTLLGVGGIWVALIQRRFMTDAAVAHKDPQLLASMRYDNV